MILRLHTFFLVFTSVIFSDNKLLVVKGNKVEETVADNGIKASSEGDLDKISDTNQQPRYAFPDTVERRQGDIGGGPTFSSYKKSNFNGAKNNFPINNQYYNQGSGPNNPLPQNYPQFTSSNPSDADFLNAISNLQQQPINMPQVVGIDVKCSKKAMLVRVRFNVPFNGVIYAKGHYKNPDCRYVRANGGKSTYEFTVQHDRCGTTFADNFRNGGQAYLENTLIIQMEPGIQEVWDAARRIKCLWNGLFQKTVGSRINVDMLDIVSITYSGDAVDTYMDIQIGQGPNAPVATGLVKIGETLTMVVYVLGSNDLDVHVRECFAFSTDRAYSIQLTDSSGCVIKEKLIGPWITTTQTNKHGGIGRNSGASIISYAFLQAFKFPDTMDVNLECNVIICKYKCRTACPRNNIRSKRNVPEGDNQFPTDEPQINSTSSSPTVTLVRTIRVLSPDDIPISINSNENSSVVTLQTNNNPTLYSGTDIFGQEAGDAICMSTPTFVISLVIIMIIMIISCVFTALLCIRIKNNPAANKSSLLTTRRTVTRRTRTPTTLLSSSTSNA